MKSRLRKAAGSRKDHSDGTPRKQGNKAKCSGPTIEQERSEAEKEVEEGKADESVKDSMLDCVRSPEEEANGNTSALME